MAIEAGIHQENAFARVVIENQQRRDESRSASFMLPPLVAEGIAAGREPGDEITQLTGCGNIKQQGGAISIFTAGLLSRTSAYYQAVILALCPFHHALYNTQSNFAASQSVNA